MRVGSDAGWVFEIRDELTARVRAGCPIMFERVSILSRQLTRSRDWRIALAEISAFQHSRGRSSVPVAMKEFPRVLSRVSWRRSQRSSPATHQGHFMDSRITDGHDARDDESPVEAASVAGRKS